MPLMVSWEQIKAMRPCEGRYRACRAFVDLPDDEAWPLSRLLDMPDKGQALDDALWVLVRLPGGLQAGVSLAADYAERVLPLYEKAFPGCDRPRRAIEAARAWVANPCPDTDIAREAARVAARGAAWHAAYAARATVGDTQWSATTARTAALNASDAARDEELEWQINRLREVLNAP